MVLTVIVPGDDFYELASEGQDLVPTIPPEEIAREDPVFAVGYFWSII
jgi:hypothetical protein